MTNKSELGEKMDIAHRFFSYFKRSAFKARVEPMKTHVEKWVHDPFCDVHSFARKMIKYVSDTDKKYDMMVESFAYARRQLEDSGRKMNEEAYHRIVIRIFEIVIDPDVEPRALLEKVLDIASEAH